MPESVSGLAQRLVDEGLLLLDEMFPASIAQILRSDGYDVAAVQEVQPGTGGKPSS